MDRVTVFEAGARVTRRASLQHPAPAEVIIFGLPLGLLDDSVRVSASGAVATMATVLLEAPGENDKLAAPTSTEVIAARRAAALADGEIERLRRELEAIEQSPLVVELGDKEPPASWAASTVARRQLAALRQHRTSELRLAMIEAQRHAKDCGRVLAAAVEQEARRSSERSPRAAELRKAVRVTLTPAGATAGAEQAAGQGAVELSLEYAVRGARWVPSYVARIESGSVELTMRASLVQRTGEDWRGVALELSTAALDRHSELPELAALRLGKRQPAAPPRYRPPPQGVDELFADFSRELTRAAAAPAAPPAAPASSAKPMPPTEVVLAGGPLPRPGPSGPLVGPVMFGLPHGPGDGAYGSGAEEEVDTKVDLARRSAPGSAPSSAAGAARPAPGAPPPMAVQALRKSASAETSTLRTVVGGSRAKARDSAVYHDDALAAPRPSPDRGTGAGPSGRPGDALVAQLDFHGLMMAGFDHPQRGQLVAMSLAVRYQLSDPGKLSGADAGRLQHRLAAASQAAERVEQSEPPAGMSCDWSHDFDYALAAEGRIDVPSDGGWHSIPLCTRTTSARVRHVGVPREQPDVFRSATAHNPFEAPLLPGPVDVYDGSRFLVTAPLPMVAPGGELELPLGVDPSIKIARNTEYREEVTGMLRGGLRLIHDLRIDIHNHSATPIDLEIRERVPVPREHDSDEIQVKVTACKPPWQPLTPPLGSPHDQELRGGHAWRLEVAARGTANLTATYEIQIAAKHEVIGGNRRES